MAKTNNCRIIVPNKEQRDRHVKRNNYKDSNIPSFVDINVLTSAVNNKKAIAGKATIKESDGSTKEMDVICQNGINYNADTGQRVLDFNGNSTSTIYRNSDIADVQYNINGDTGDLKIICKPNPPLSPSGPPVPDALTPNKSKPTFESDVKQYTKYEYFFGINGLSLMRMKINQNCCLTTKPIEIPKDCEYIKLDCDYYCNEFSSIEFYIIYNGVEYPIIPVNDKLIRNEKIFYMQPTRFPIDITQPMLIKKDNIKSNITLDSAKLKQDAIYNISYKPYDMGKFKSFAINNNVEDSNNKIQIKMTLRLYDKFEIPPRIYSICIRQYGGKTLWKDSI